MLTQLRAGEKSHQPTIVFGFDCVEVLTGHHPFPYVAFALATLLRARRLYYDGCGLTVRRYSLCLRVFFSVILKQC